MAKLKPAPSAPVAAADGEILRAPAEVKYAEELSWLRSIDDGARPTTWQLSPRLVRVFVLGSTPADRLEREVRPKFFGDPGTVERAIVTLASDRGLLLIGDPGTGKSWLAELLAAAICGNSTHVVQGTAGTTEDQIKYSWNVAMVIAAGQSRESLIPSPIMTAMQQGLMGRFEELTRCSSDVQDALISILSEKYVTIPELKGDNVVFARPGFNIIATANARDRGVNELSSALKRRFNFVQIPVVTNKKTEKEIVLFRTRELLARNRFAVELPPAMLEILLQTFAELREASAAETSEDSRLESALSTAEQIGVLEDAVLHGQFFGEGALAPGALARSLVGTLVRRIPEDVSILNKFWHASITRRAKTDDADWRAFEAYLEGLLLALVFTPLVSGLTVELLSKAFARLPDRLLMLWLPALLMKLRPHADLALPVLIKEAAALYPGNLDALAGWQPPWSRPASPSGPGSGSSATGSAPKRVVLGPSESAVARLLASHPSATDALGGALGLPISWTGSPAPSGALGDDSTASSEYDAVRRLLGAFPATLHAAALPFG